MIVIASDQFLLARFNALRAELADLAFELECQGRCDAADVTNQLGVRLAEFAGELAAHGSDPTQPNPFSQPVSLSAAKNPVRSAVSIPLDSSPRPE